MPGGAGGAWNPKINHSPNFRASFRPLISWRKGQPANGIANLGLAYGEMGTALEGAK